MKNLCAKTVKRENAYEVWTNGTWTWYVLKKWQSPDKEKDNEYARWFCKVVSPMTPNGEIGDCYVNDIIKNATRIK